MSSTASTKVDFSALPWQSTAPGVRFKAVTRQGKKLRLVEFSAEFVEPGWCLKGHLGCVLTGELELEFVDRTERFVVGDGLFILAGDTEKHRVHVSGAPATLLLVEDD